MTAAPTAPSLGIVTVLYLSDEVLDGFFSSLATQIDLAFRLYVIDNSPTDSGTARGRDLAKRHGIDALFVFNNANVGVARGNNQGIERALRDGCTHVLLANNDVEFAPPTLKTLLIAARRHGGIATPKIHYFEPDGMVWYAGGSIQPWRALVHHRGMRAKDSGQFDVAGNTGYAPTCFMMIDAAILRRVGPMDERYFVYYDDVDFAWRLRHNGFHIHYEPMALVLHKVSTSTGGERSPFTVYWSNRNRILFIRKQLKGWQRWTALSYTLLTRLPRWIVLPRAIASRLVKGVRDGLTVNLHPAPGNAWHDEP